MHTLLKVTMSDVECANEAIRNGALQKVIQQVSKLINPEATFFAADQGYRTGFMIFDLKDVSLIPQIAEPFFNILNAKVEFLPGMDVKELAAGLDSWKKQEPTYESLQ